jgi:hypothetical protein
VTGSFTGRSGAAASVVDGKIYVFGGYSNTAGGLNSVDVFDPATSTWTTAQTTGSFPATYGLTSSPLDGKIYVIGGDGSAWGGALMFDPSTNAWSTPVTAGTFSSRTGLSAATSGGKIFVLGGDDGLGGTHVLNLNQVFTPGPSTSVNDPLSESGIQIYPNPTSGVVHARGSITSISVTNILGETVASGISDCDLSGCAAGTYYARCVTPSGVVIRKIVRE